MQSSSRLASRTAAHGRAHLAAPDQGLHLHQVHHAHKVVLSADGQLDGQRVGAQVGDDLARGLGGQAWRDASAAKAGLVRVGGACCERGLPHAEREATNTAQHSAQPAQHSAQPACSPAHHVAGAVEVGTQAVHLVHEADAGHVVLVGLEQRRGGNGDVLLDQATGACWTGAAQFTRNLANQLLPLLLPPASCCPIVAAASHLAPHGLGLGLHTRHRVKHGNGTVQHAQCTLHLRFNTAAAGMRGQNAAGGGLQGSTIGTSIRQTVGRDDDPQSRATQPALVQLPPTE